jgi:hypothetical protein
VNPVNIFLTYVRESWESTRVEIEPCVQTVRLEEPDDRAVIEESRAQVWLARADGRRVVENFDVECQ